MAKMFWGLTLEDGKQYSQTVNQSFHISMAALECSTDGVIKNQPVAVMLEHDKAEFLLCTLQYGRLMQQQVDLQFIEGEQVIFYLNGKGTVHLTGYLTPMDQDDADFNDSSAMLYDSEAETSEDDVSDDDDDDEQDSELESKGRKRSQKLETLFSGKKRKTENSNEVSFQKKLFTPSDDDEEELSPKKKLQKTPSPKKQQQKMVSQKTASGQNQSVSQKNKLPALTNLPAGKSPAYTPGVTMNGPVKEVAANSETPASKKKNKKRRKKSLDTSQSTNLTTPSGTVTSPAMQASAKKTSQITPNNSLIKKDAQAAQTPSGSKKLPGGTAVEEVTVGSGPIAKNGKFISISYCGRLANNKVFDKSNLLRFRLGKNELISGMDLGIAGMKVGGKRKITIPPNQGYGSKAMGPIPANSTLVFDVELKAVNN